MVSGTAQRGRGMLVLKDKSQLIVVSSGGSVWRSGLGHGGPPCSWGFCHHKETWLFLSLYKLTVSLAVLEAEAEGLLDLRRLASTTSLEPACKRVHLGEVFVTVNGLLSLFSWLGL